MNVCGVFVFTAQTSVPSLVSVVFLGGRKQQTQRDEKSGVFTAV